jgi:DNA mismatch repair protein MutS2
MIPDRSLRLLEFDKLLGLAAGYTHSEASRKAVFALRPLDSLEAISGRLALIQEIRRMLHEGAALPLSAFSDISDLLARVRPEGAVLEPLELATFMPFLRIAGEVPVHVADRKDTPALKELARDLSGFPEIHRLIERSIDPEGQILDRATPELFALRNKTRALRGRIRRRLEDVVRSSRVSVFLQDDFITDRSGRWVIPVRMDSKGMVPGVVHDVSKSGETAFVEPLAIIPLANELENLSAEQKAEEIRILRTLSSRIRGAAPEMAEEFRTVVYLDMLYAIAAFSEHLRMEAPRINESGIIEIVKARHPLLLWASVRGEGEGSVVPLDVRLGGETTVMVITGSNAGGKTVAIKTVGILLLMALSGMPVPADSSTSIPLTQTVLVDMGDEQSLEANLSTFAAHVANIASILGQAGQGTLVLVDELGTGTDPDEGTALACAILSELRLSRALAFATTHLTGIKGFVHRTGGMVNAAMEFDRRTLSPLYRLRIGEPGQSHALETARRYGMPDQVVKAAKEFLGGATFEIEELMADLNQKRKQHEEGLEELRRRQSEIDATARMLREREAESEASARKVLREAHQEASGVVARARQQMHALIEEMKKADRARAQEAARQAASVQDELARKLAQYEDGDAGGPSIDEIMEGDVVFARTLGCDAPVLEVDLKHSRLRLQAGAKEVEVPLSDIGFRRGKSLGAVRSLPAKEMQEESLQSRLNLIGLRVDDALSKLEPFLNHAALSGLSEVTVIHGIGKGLLSRAVRDHLKGHPLVSGFRPGDQSEGGGGVTVVTLK